MAAERFVITGAGSGIGLALARLAAARGHALALLVRDEAARQALANIFAGARGIEVVACDLSQASAITACGQVLQQRQAPIDVLVHCAAVYSETRREASDGIELTLAVNALAPFRLNHALTGLLEMAQEPRVIHVGSIGERWATLDWADPMSRLHYSGNTAYNRSKLLLSLLARRFAKLHEGRIACVCVHPGATRTGLVSAANIALMPWPLRWVFRCMAPWRQSPERAARILYQLATRDALMPHSGEFFIKTRPARATAAALQREEIDHAWRLFEALDAHGGAGCGD